MYFNGMESLFGSYTKSLNMPILRSSSPDDRDLYEIEEYHVTSTCELQLLSVSINNIMSLRSLVQ